MSLFSFGIKKSSRRTNRRRSIKKYIKRVGNKVHVNSRGGKIKILKVKVNKNGREYYVSGINKTKHYLSKRRKVSRKASRRGSRRGSRRRSRRGSRRRSRKFGYNKNTLLSMMGNFAPAEMSLAQSTTGLSPEQMIIKMDNTPLSNRSNFYTNFK